MTVVSAAVGVTGCEDTGYHDHHHPHTTTTVYVPTPGHKAPQTKVPPVPKAPPVVKVPSLKRR